MTVGGDGMDKGDFLTPMGRILDWGREVWIPACAGMTGAQGRRGLV